MQSPLVGKILICIGLFISLNPYWIIFIGSPVFVLGAIIYWSTNNSKKSKLLWTLIPILFWWPLYFSSIWLHGEIGTALAQKRDYIIPEDLKAKQLVIMESKCGKIPPVINDRLQFEFPSNGIYLFNGSLKSGYINERYFLKRENGALEVLESKYWLDDFEIQDTSGSQVIIGLYGGTFGSYNSLSKEKINKITKLIAFNKLYDDKALPTYSKREKILDSLRINCP
ncbi:MAG: hypothetical protein AAF705_01065 [Bacteroidota bacterium]